MSPLALLALHQNTELKALTEKFGAAMNRRSTKGPIAQLWVLGTVLQYGKPHEGIHDINMQRGSGTSMPTLNM